MKKVILTNATVIPFFKRNANDADEILRIVSPKEGSTFDSTIINFNIETKSVDTAESKSKMFEKCTIYAKDPAKINVVKDLVKAGAILELDGYEKRTKSEKDGKYYNSIIIKNIVPISAGIDNEPGQPAVTPINNNMDDDDELPF
jgi:hypothetical protein